MAAIMEVAAMVEAVGAVEDGRISLHWPDDLNYLHDFYQVDVNKINASCIFSR